MVSGPFTALTTCAFCTGPAAIAVAFVVVLLYAWIRSRRRRRARAAPGESELLLLYDRLQRRIGRRRAPPETPLEYLRGVDAGAIETLLNEMTEAVNAGVYAGRWPDRSRVSDWWQRLG